jgi:hypothetical protein
MKDLTKTLAMLAYTAYANIRQTKSDGNPLPSAEEFFLAEDHESQKKQEGWRAGANTVALFVINQNLTEKNPTFQVDRTHTHYPLGCFDAKEWADEFHRLYPYFDHGSALGWFSSSIMTGYDYAVRQLDDTCSFGWAMREIQKGSFVRRTWWPEGTYIWFMPAAQVPAAWCKEPHLRALADASPNQELQCLETIRSKNVDGSVTTGWLPNHSDLFSKDWVIYDQPSA